MNLLQFSFVVLHYWWFPVETKHPTQSQETLKASTAMFWLWKITLIRGQKWQNVDELCEGSWLYSQLIEIATVALSRAGKEQGLQELRLCSVMAFFNY